MSLKIVSWNIDGLSEIPLNERLDVIFSLLISVDPDIILFQEVIPRVVRLLDQNLRRLGYFSPDPASAHLPYFCRSYLKLIFQTSLISSSFVDFPQSQMSRGYNTILLQLESQNHLLILNTHLESCKESAHERKNQLQQCFRVLSTHAGPGILAGDLNLRDNEIKSKKEFPQLYQQRSSSSSHSFSHPQIIDCWEQAGSVPDSRFTWFLCTRPDIRARFDRVYYKDDNCNSETVESFDLLAKEFVQEGSISNSVPYLSDHCGVIVKFQLPSRILTAPITTTPPTSAPSTVSQQKRKSVETKEESEHKRRAEDMNLNYYDLT
jgi:endonuclease/exonuclease/phosphatase family metal-dependent hydrolase